MIGKNTLIKVTNRSGASVGYEVPDLGVTRRFNNKETKEISAEELRKLSYVPGGMYIIQNCLRIDNEELVKELLGQVEPEYAYTEEDIKSLLLNGSLDELLDCLDFAPDGVIQLIKDFAVKYELNDVKKRKAIFNKTGFNIDKAIEINNISQEEKPQEETGVARRINKENESEGGSSRRTAPPKYKVLGK